MYGDFARMTFDALRNRSRVLMQQGRVQLEADWNEQAAIFHHLLRTLARDLIGPEGGPEANCGFQILTRKWLEARPESDERRRWLEKMEATDFLIDKGNYYVDGVLCENPEPVQYTAQRSSVGAPPDTLALSTPSYLVYLDVVEHSVFAAQDESMLEVAIGIETAIRARRSWVVRTVPVTAKGGGCDDITPSWAALVDGWQGRNRGWMRCRAGKMDDMPSDPCNVSAESRYRGAENQLYRVEVHTGGVIGGNPKPKGKPAGQPVAGDRPTFKFSRVNGSAVYKIASFTGDVVTLADLGRDDRLRLDERDWVEILDDTTVLPDKPAPLRQVASVDTFSRKVTLHPATSGNVGRDPAKHPIMRRWDQRQKDPNGRGLQLQDGVAPIELDTWLPLEDGIEIKFESPKNTTGGVVFRAGDYWLAPARVATGDIIDWPRDDNGDALPIPPHGVDHHYARLAILSVEGGQLTVTGQCRRSFELISKIVTKTV